MAIPSISIPVGRTITGKTSWFGGPHDSSDSGHTASGIPESRGGIAVYNQATLRGYWRVKFPNGRTLDLQQTDLGPAPWTGKAVDVLYSSLGAAGYTEQNFPTGGAVSATYLGKTPGVKLPALPDPSLPAPATSTSTSPGPTRKSIGSDLLYALLFAGIVAGGAILLGIGLNRAGGGAPAHTTKKVARTSILAAA